MPRRRKPFEEYMRDQWAALASDLRMDVRGARRLARRYKRVFEVPFGTAFAIGRASPRTGKTVWHTPPGKRGPKRLHWCHLIGHLRQGPAIAVVRTQPTRLLTIDLDAKTPAAKASLADRYRGVRNALGGAPHVLIRSSHSGGLHLLFFLTTAQAPVDLNRMVVSVLTNAGLAVSPGEIEVRPSGGQKIRLPLGPGSVILSRRTLNPSRVRDRAGALRLLHRLAEKRRVPISRLINRSPQHAPVVPVVPPLPAPPAAGRFPRPFSPAHAARLKACINGVSGYHRRWEESGFLLWHWTVVERLPRAEVLAKFEQWVRHGKHRSQDLEQNHARTVRRMLLDAPGGVDWYLAQIRSCPVGGIAPLRRGRGSSMAAFVSEAKVRARSLGLSWREFVLRFLKRTDRRALAKLHNPWIRQKVGLFKAILNFGLAEVNRHTHVSMWSRTLQAIMGGRPPPGPVRFLWGKERPRGAAYALVLRKAERLGWIRLLSDAAEGRSRVYEVILDRRRRKRDPEDSS